MAAERLCLSGWRSSRVHPSRPLILGDPVQIIAARALAGASAAFVMPATLSLLTVCDDHQSILASSYSHAIGTALTPFPEPVRGPASDSLAQALAVADRLRPQEQQLVEASKTAFVDAVDSSYLVMAAIVGVAAIVIPLFAPGRDGRQLRVVRLLRNRRTAMAD